MAQVLFPHCTPSLDTGPDLCRLQQIIIRPEIATNEILPRTPIFSPEVRKFFLDLENGVFVNGAFLRPKV